MKILKILPGILFVLSVPLFFLSTAIGIACNSAWWYDAGMTKYQVDQVTGIDRTQLKLISRGLIHYFNSDEEYIDLMVIKDGKDFTVFNMTEVLHLRDVKKLIWLDYKVWLGCLLYILVYSGVMAAGQPKAGWLRISSGFFYGSILTLGLMALMLIGVLTGFERLFWEFHIISFSNDFWLLDPSRDYLILLFPEGFWYDSSMLVGGTCSGLALTVLFYGMWRKWYSKPRLYQTATFKEKNAVSTGSGNN